MAVNLEPNNWKKNRHRQDGHHSTAGKKEINLYGNADGCQTEGQKLDLANEGLRIDSYAYVLTAEWVFMLFYVA